MIIFPQVSIYKSSATFKYPSLFHPFMIHKKKLQRLTKIVLPLLKKYGVARAGIFGSYARGEETKNSDIDMLVEFKGRKSLLDLVRLERELQDLLGEKVDLLTYNSINHIIKERIMKEEVKIL